MNLFSITGKKILITGASSGIGKELAIKFSQQDAILYVTGRDEVRLTETFQSLQHIQRHTMIVTDLTDEKNIVSLVNEISELDGVVFSAGVVEYMPVKFLSDKKISTIMSINFNSQVLLTQNLLKSKKINRNASLVYVSSISSKLGVSGTAIYSASKSAINSFMKVTASELSSLKIRANSICPGIVLTPMGKKAQESSSNAEKQYPLGLGEPNDIVGPCQFLLSDASKWITGTELIIDGGLTLM